MREEHGVDACDDHRESLLDVRPHGIGGYAEDSDGKISLQAGVANAADRITNIGVIDGVVFMPSALGMTFGLLPSITATQELVVPRSIPMTLLICARSSFNRQVRRGPRWHRAGTPLLMV